MVVGRIVLKPNLYLDGAEHGTESKDGGAVPYCGFTVKCSLGVHQQDGNLEKNQSPWKTLLCTCHFSPVHASNKNHL